MKLIPKCILVATFLIIVARTNERKIVTFLLSAVAMGLIWIFEPVISSWSVQANPRDDLYFWKRSESTAKKIDTSSVNLTLVVPAYNEELRLPIMLDSTFAFMSKWSAQNNITYEVLIVDDGSKDNTCEVCKCYMDKGFLNVVRLLKLGCNRGKGGAIRRGISWSRGEYVLMVDADGATEISDLPKLWAAMKRIEKPAATVLPSTGSDSSVGMVVGSRAHMEGDSVATRAWYRTVLMKGFHLLVTLLCTSHIRDTQCGFKLFTRDTARVLFHDLHLERWAFDIEIIYVAELLRTPLAEVAVNWQEIAGSKLIETKWDIVTTSLTMARDMLCVRLSYLLGVWSVNVNKLYRKKNC